MKRKYVIGLDASGIDSLIRGLEEYEKWLNEKAKVLISRLSERGYEVASAGFGSAEYDGVNDVTVDIDDRGELRKAVVAIGNAALFIEFGTGVVYPDNHPDKPAGIAGRGEYGKGHGSQRTWGYYGDELGSHGVYATTKKGKIREPHVVLTHGNPANMPMYLGAKTVKEEFEAIVKEVFSDD